MAAIRQARESCRMAGFATYRIAETVRVLLLITLAIVNMNFFPVTAVMIVFLALLIGGAILAIAYDDVRASAKPAALNMRACSSWPPPGPDGVAETFRCSPSPRRCSGCPWHPALIYLRLSVPGT